jgi:hypothetical protein
VIYFVNPSTQVIRDAIRERRDLGIIATPNSTRPSQWVDDARWIADNGCFGKNFNEDHWWRWLKLRAEPSDDFQHDRCLFATAPDVVGDHGATVERSAPWLARIRDLGYPAAFVAQDGATASTVPWDDLDALFLGGTTEFKLSTTARGLTGEALARGKHVHMGRVNSNRRLRLAHAWGCHSVDGTYLVFGPTVNLPKLVGWLDELQVTASEPTDRPAQMTLLGWFDDTTGEGRP